MEAVSRTGSGRSRRAPSAGPLLRRGRRLASGLEWAVLPAAIAALSRLFGCLLLVVLNAFGPRGFSRLIPPVNAFSAWDGQWYQWIAANGYSATPVSGGRADYAFFPLWPMILSPGPATTARWILGVVLANGLFVAAAVVVWRVLADVFDEPTATGATGLLAFSPLAFVFSMLYAESLFLLLAAGSLLAIRRARGAGIVVGALVGLTRVTSIAVAAAAVVAAVRSTGRRRRAALAIGAATGLALVAWLGFAVVLTGDPAAYFRNQAGWSPGTSGLPGLVAALATPTPATALRLAFAGLVIVASIALVRIDLELAAYALVCEATGVLFGASYSLPRYVLVAFPAYAILARWAGRRGTLVLGLVFAALEVVFAAMSINPRPVAPL